MYRCSWIINDTQCSNTTNHLVCRQCRGEKNELYHKYKQTEKTIINALSSPPRGDLLEVSKVIGRISKVVTLRTEFTNRIVKQVRDSGHEYHVSKLLEVMLSYKEYLKKLITSPTKVEDVTDEYIDNTISYSNVVSDSITKVVKNDPFANFDTTIAKYIQERTDYERLLVKYSRIKNISSYEAKLVVAFVSQQLTVIGSTMNVINKLLSSENYVLVLFRPKYAELEDIESDTLRSLIDHPKLTNETMIKWIIDNANNRVKFILTRWKVDGNDMILSVTKSSTSIYPYTYNVRITIRSGKLAVDPVYLSTDDPSLESLVNYFR